MPRKFKRSDITDFQVCQAYWVKHAIYRDMMFATEILEAETGMPIKVVYAAIERAASRGYVEYGTSLRSGWLTTTGQELLRANG